MYRKRTYKEIHTKKYRNKRHCKQTNKQSEENTKMGEIDTNKYRVKRRHKHKRLDHPFKYPAEREKKTNNENKLCLSCMM